MPPVNSRQTGERYEKIALSHLEQQGLLLIAQNVYYPVGEIDLIMKDRQTLVFIEVRFRRTNAFGGAVYSVSQRKRHRLLQAAALWLMENDGSFDNTDCRFDLCAITGNQLEWIQNAFSEDNIYY